MRIVYQSFEGRYSDSPRAIYEALAARGSSDEHVWLVDPAHAGGFPPDVAAVEYGSSACVAALESADVLIANTHTDLDWRKAPGAVYLQTWHGTPLKRIHWDVRWAPAGRLERLSADVARWDYLISPNHPTTPLLRGGFRFAGPVLETGYPRNDPLARPEHAAARARLRRELEIAEGETAVLYAPTWRDDMVFEEGRKAFQLGLDLEAFADALGDGHCLLARLHPLLTGRMRQVDHKAVRDVCYHPEIAELYLAADVLVTDYSSAMFDFAVTGRPILLHTPDLADYESRLRGFYFDLADVSPGPLLDTAEELLGALADLDGVRTAHAERYERFRRRFCHLDDGYATERVIRSVPELAA